MSFIDMFVIYTTLSWLNITHNTVKGLINITHQSLCLASTSYILEFSFNFVVFLTAISY